jgi:hypothetical protein
MDKRDEDGEGVVVLYVCGGGWAWGWVKRLAVWGEGKGGSV